MKYLLVFIFVFVINCSSVAEEIYSGDFIVGSITVGAKDGSFSFTSTEGKIPVKLNCIATLQWKDTSVLVHPENADSKLLLPMVMTAQATGQYIKVRFDKKYCSYQLIPIIEVAFLPKTVALKDVGNLILQK
ncbi:MAG: hypothetical protein H7A09_00555 [Oceanospirillaceae bacterium]|nr:hypothetical protein [Oceanospirillaceae bacterium]MCP5335863.1 hypothetical protein [Oceanospirillaceae bacterium]MCP5351133.1 hypothetical protein [Oceanospirillaceae bacterium]